MESQKNSARLKLEQILQDLAIKAEESLQTTEEEDGLKGSPSDNDAMPPPATPSKRSGRAPRKRRKKEMIHDDFAEANRPSCVLKLFDRSVDMAQFKKDTSIYAMCRSWALNKPAATYELGTSAKQETELDEFRILFSGAMEMDQGEKRFPQAPKAVNAAERLDKVMDAVRDVSILQRDNVTRWRKVREGWRQASFAVQQRHMASLTTLKSLFTQP